MGGHFDIANEEDQRALSALLAKMPETKASSLTHMPVMRGTDLSDEEGDESRLKSMLRRLRRRS